MYQQALDVPPVSTWVDEVSSWANEFDALAERISPHFACSEARVRARDYLVGLLFWIGLIGDDDIKQLPSFITTNAA